MYETLNDIIEITVKVAMYTSILVIGLFIFIDNDDNDNNNYSS